MIINLLIVLFLVSIGFSVLFLLELFNSKEDVKHRRFSFLLLIRDAIILALLMSCVAFFTLGMGFVDVPHQYEGDVTIASVEYANSVHLPTVVALVDVNQDKQYFCAKRELYGIIKDSIGKTVHIVYGRGWFLPFWYCNIDNDIIYNIN